MRSRYRVGDSRLTFFVTSTIVEWLPVFTTRACCDILADALAYCQTHRSLRVYAWVVLDNHFHAIVSHPELSRTVAAIKRHTAKLLLAQIQQEGRDWLLNRWAYYRAKHKVESEHQIWQEGFHPQEVTTDEDMSRTLDYVHYNPVERGLVWLPEHWRYSSAHEALPGSKPVFRCDRWR